MSMSFGQGGGHGRGSESQDFELNLASIIDCFTVLIAFMLASTAFLSIGILDAGVAAAGNTATDNSAPPPVNLELVVSNTKTMSIKVTGKTNSNFDIAAAKDGTWNLAEMNEKLTGLHQQWPTVNAITLTADNSVEYQDVIKTMDSVRKTIPVVLLGGF
jgi:biopolymer transport protein ExbD